MITTRCVPWIELHSLQRSPLVLNLQTGSITTQYHVVFDDSFSTVASIGKDEDPPEYWDDLCLENTTYIPNDSNTETPMHLQDDWLTSDEQAQKQRELHRQQRIRTTFPPTHFITAALPPEGPSTPAEQNIGILEGASAPIPPPKAPIPLSTDSAHTKHIPDSIASSPHSSPPVPAVRRSERTNKGHYNCTKYIDEVYLTMLDQTKHDNFYKKQLAYSAELLTCFDTGVHNITDPRVYAAKTRRKDDPDSPTFHQAIHGENSEEYIKAMQIEIATLILQRTWESVPRTANLHVLKGTWVFKLKRLPDGTPYRFKSRYCARGDLQKEGIDFFETYAPDVLWSTMRLLLLTVLTEGWSTRQVDYTNAFAQADLKEEVYLEYPCMFGPKSGTNKVLRLLKNLYGLRQAPCTFFEKLREGLLEHGYTQSQIDPCLFMKQGIICVCYVDDTIFAGADSLVLEAEIQSLGVHEKEQRHTFALRNEGEVGAFLGIQIKKLDCRNIISLKPD